MAASGQGSNNSAVPQPQFRGEMDAWRDIVGAWQPIHGRLLEEGVSLEWHDFRLENDSDWARSFHADSLEICLNYSGEGWFLDGTAKRRVGPEQVAIYATGKGRSEAVREVGSWHRFLTLECSRDFLRGHFGECLAQVKAPVRKFIEGECLPWLEITDLPAALLGMRSQLLEPPVPNGARPTWCRSKALEVLAQTIFAPDDSAELFCHRHQRLNQDRAARVCFLLERDLENPPSLEMLAREVGCSPSHLSRVFSEATGGSIPKYLRTKRIERAAELLGSGRMNVTEAAMAVGYASLAGFNKAFVEQIGCCPGLYPAMRAAGRLESTESILKQKKRKSE